MRCPQCDAVYPAGNRFCPLDGETLIASNEALVGQRVEDRYDVLARIGQGGHGTVYRARQLAVDRQVAIKVLAADADPTVAARFEAEARTLSRLRHPNTVQLIDFGHLEDGRPFLVSPFVEGPTLRGLLADGPLPEPVLLDVLTQLAGALEEAHAAGVVHRDLKPANVMLESIAGRRVVRLIDFGIARQAEDIRLTADLQTVGTAAYMAPEQIRGEAVDGRADLYSLGVLAYECLSGALPFDGPTRTAVIMQHLNDPPPALPASPLAEIIEWCLEKQAADRPPDATALMDALADATAPVPQTSASPPSRAKLWLAAGLLLGIAVMGVFIGWSGPEKAAGPSAAAASQPISAATSAPTSSAPPSAATVSAPASVAPPSKTMPATTAPITAPVREMPPTDAPVSHAPRSVEPARPASRPRRVVRKAPAAPRTAAAATVAPVTAAPAAPRTAPKPPAGLF